MSAGFLIACHECDALQRAIALPPGDRARCVRCNAELYRAPKHPPGHAVAAAATAAVLLVLANAFPIIGLDVQGQQTHATLFGAARALHGEGMTAIAAVVLGTLVVAPALAIGMLLYLLAPLGAGRLAPGFAPLFRVLQSLGPWQMFEVFMLGILVSVAKLMHLASVVPGIGLWAFFALMFASIAANAAYDPHDVWRRADAARVRRARR